MKCDVDTVVAFKMNLTEPEAKWLRDELQNWGHEEEEEEEPQAHYDMRKMFFDSLTAAADRANKF